MINRWETWMVSLSTPTATATLQWITLMGLALPGTLLAMLLQVGKSLTAAREPVAKRLMKKKHTMVMERKMTDMGVTIMMA